MSLSESAEVIEQSPQAIEGKLQWEKSTEFDSAWCAKADDPKGNACYVYVVNHDGTATNIRMPVGTIGVDHPRLFSSEKSARRYFQKHSDGIRWRCPLTKQQLSYAEMDQQGIAYVELGVNEIPSVKVIKLEWTKYTYVRMPGYTEWRARCPIGEYLIMRCKEDISTFVLVTTEGENKPPFESLEQAKEFAEKDFESTVLKCLQVEGV